MHFGCQAVETSGELGLKNCRQKTYISNPNAIRDPDQAGLLAPHITGLLGASCFGNTVALKTSKTQQGPATCGSHFTDSLCVFHTPSLNHAGYLNIPIISDVSIGGDRRCGGIWMDSPRGPGQKPVSRHPTVARAREPPTTAEATTAGSSAGGDRVRIGANRRRRRVMPRRPLRQIGQEQDHKRDKVCGADRPSKASCADTLSSNAVQSVSPCRVPAGDRREPLTSQTRA